ncbi:hypothetical protein [Methylophaga thalassica]|jgi:hypothetical protein|uniref:hypothetical protein n=1 Tax=Methylophaga thalassica TaxID=40223 RepID=UPI002E7AE8B0|nr:hypothetical protein [Methylophaga thalassica]WVI83758.1 hypothetical protein VSX76_01580 [Methylophaga thalassica]|tara:strand:- start:6689 stop:6952 length:264 start_codon:yes stop_codon:yes gene_type:complete
MPAIECATSDPLLAYDDRCCDSTYQQPSLTLDDLAETLMVCGLPTSEMRAIRGFLSQPRQHLCNTAAGDQFLRHGQIGVWQAVQCMQ